MESVKSPPSCPAPPIPKKRKFTRLVDSGVMVLAFLLPSLTWISGLGISSIDFVSGVGWEELEGLRIFPKIKKPMAKPARKINKKITNPTGLILGNFIFFKVFLIIPCSRGSYLSGFYWQVKRFNKHFLFQSQFPTSLDLSGACLFPAFLLLPQLFLGIPYLECRVD